MARPTPPAPFGVIFDWDGVLVDSSAAHERSWEILASKRGQKLPPDHFKRGFGMVNDRVVREVLGWSHDTEEVRLIGAMKELYFREIVRGSGIQVLPGADALLSALARGRVPCAIGSSTPLLNLLQVLHILGWFRRLEHLVSADDVTHGKPSPEVFLVAAQRMGLPAERCVVVEDALVGIEAARAAGMKVLAVATTRRPEELTAADRIVSSLADVDVEQLAGMFPG